MSTDVPPIHFAQARGARIAYQDFGSGPPTILAIPPLAQNIELAWERQEIRSMFERFASFCRFIHFDKRGTGASDKHTGVSELDQQVDDVRALMDHLELDSAHFYVQSEGGPMSILFAATYPDRVESLILFGTGATMIDPDLDPDERAALPARAEAISHLWGTPESPVLDAFAPSLAGDPEFRTWFQRYERHAATPHSLRELLAFSAAADVRDLLSSIDVPTLVMHRTGDRIPIDGGRALADGIPGSRFVELDGDDHYSFVNSDQWFPEVERFLTGQVSERPPRHTPTAVRILTLGRFAVEVDGEEVPVSEWGSRRARQLLKRLVAARGWPVTRDELMDLLWPDEYDVGKLSARLSVLLSTVRRILDGGVIADRQSVRLDLGAVSTDLEDFHLATDDAAIVASYGGLFLPDDVYDDWTASTRDEVRSRFVTAAHRVAVDAHERGDHDRAASIVRRLIEADAYDAPAHRLLVLSLHAAGAAREAERAHAAWMTAMDEIGDTVPSLDDVIGS
jgi:pimeloyl-ACP methyl ester carboxylesterase/DNA-binding SARP family transcriptional activator